MFKEITSISKNYAIVKLKDNINEDLLNLNAIFEEEDKKILGEIEEVIDKSAKITFLGEFNNGKFFSGIIRKPSLNASIRLINEEELNELTQENDPYSMPLGSSPLYNNCKINVNIDNLFSNHTAIFGNTGSGKTYGVARLVQNLFTLKDKIPFNSNFFIFNNTSEYDNAFKEINKYNVNFNYKAYTTSDTTQNNSIKIPLWLLSADDYANLLDATEYSQISVIEKMLSLVSVFARDDKEAHRYKNHLIAKAILSILYSNQMPARMRDQIFTIVEECHTEELNLDFEVPGVGYTREFRKCFEIDSQGQFVERVLITEYIHKFIDNDTKWKEDFIPVYFTLDDLETALNFALISEGLLLNEKSYAEGIALKVKLHTLALVKVYSRILFRFTKGLSNRGAMPIHIMLEEAHRYVQKDLDNTILGYNIFERIAKEGRKFGLILDLITQRPTELSETVISQCSNFLIFKINHPTDLEYIRKMVPNISADVIEKQKTLQSGTCVAFGPMMKIPTIVKMDLPSPEPHSANAKIYQKWMVEWKQ